MPEPRSDRTMRQPPAAVLDAELVATVLPVLTPLDPQPFDPAEPPTRPHPDAQRDRPPTSRLGRYQLFGELGRGGMGAVLRGYDPELQRELAVKVLANGAADDPDAVRRFVAEARIGGRLQHPGVVPVHELGRSLDGRPFFTMKLVEGRTLAQLLRERPGPATDLSRFLQIFEQVCQTVAYAHSRRVVHRDLKPSNVMVGAFGEVQVMDWGIAKVLAPFSGEPEATAPAHLVASGSPLNGSYAPPDLSQPGFVSGTPAYMPPEQARGETDRLDERADVFGLGAVLCEVLTGLPPYTAVTPLEVHFRASIGDLTDAFGRLDGCGADAELVGLAKHCLAPEAEDRPADAGAVAGAVAAYRAGVAERLRNAELDRAAARAAAAAERRRRRLAVALAAAVLLLAGVGGGGAGWLAWQHAQRDRDVEAALGESAERQRSGDLGAAGEALARAESRLGDGLPEALRDRVTAARVGLNRRVSQEKADLALAARLEAIRLDSQRIRGNVIDRSVAGPAYAEALRGYGLDPVGGEPDATAAKVRASAVRDALLAALDDWAMILHHYGRPEASAVAAVAQKADDDPRRRRLRALILAGDLGPLEELAGQTDWLDTPAATQVLLARGLMRAKAKPAAVLAVFREAQRRHADDFWVNFEFGTYLQLVGRNDEAVGFLRAALALRPDDASVLINLAVSLSRLGRLDDSTAAYRRALALRPESPEAMGGLGLDLLGQARFADALAWHRRAVAASPDSAESWTNLGLALSYLWDLPAAEEALRKALALQPRLPEANLNLGNVLQREHRPVEAEAAFRQALAARPDFPPAAANLGLALRRQGRYPEAVAHLRRVLAGQSPQDRGRFITQMLLADAERMQRLAADLDALAADPEKLTDGAEALAAMRAALNADRPRAAARFAARGLAVPPPDLDPMDVRRTDAARAAARAAAGLGHDAAGLPEVARASLRRQALETLRADLAVLVRDDIQPAAARRWAAEVLGQWRQEPDFAALRGAALDPLPEAERGAWQAFWAEAEALWQRSTRPEESAAGGPVVCPPAPG